MRVFALMCEVNKMQADDRFMSTTEAARRVGCHPATISRRVSNGELSSITDPRDYRRRLIEREAIERMLEPLNQREEAVTTTR